jgi:hypothetical protein
MRQRQFLVLVSCLLAGLLAVVWMPNTTWNLSVFAQNYSTLDAVIIRQVNITDTDGGANALPIAYGLGPVTDELVYREIAPDVANLLGGGEAVEIFNVPPTLNQYEPAAFQDVPEPVKVRMVGTVTIQHYYLLSINDVYLYQVNIFRSDGTLADENLLYFVYPDGKVFWFYLMR